MGHNVARVAFDSPLPQLNRLFDYAIPEHLADQISLGCVVGVTFNRSPKPIAAYVVDLLEKSAFAGELSPVASVISQRQLLTPAIYSLAQAVADRQAVALGDVLRAAIPARAVRVDNSWQPPAERENVPGHSDGELKMSSNGATTALVAKLSRPAVIQRDSVYAPSWFFDVFDRVNQVTSAGASCIVCLPDFRDIDRVVAFLAQQSPSLLLNVYAGDATPSERYARHLLAASGISQVVIGARSSLYTPLPNVGEIIVWDDEDQSHYDQASPYISSRELALLRQRVESSNLTFLSHARSVATERLVEIEYLQEIVQPLRPTVAFSETEARLDSLAYNTIREGLKKGPVLVQVAGLGQATGLYCASCSRRATCQHCGGGLWLDAQKRAVCRVCSGFNLSSSCQSCGGEERRMGRAGATRTAEELGKTFPGIRVVESVAESDIGQIGKKPQIVVSTPGVEPLATEGYSAVVILDAKISLGRDTLNALDDSIRIWANAIALGSTESNAAIIGISGELGSTLATWQLGAIAKQELEERRALGFPPAARVASASGSKTLLESLRQAVSDVAQVRILGLSEISIPGESRREHRLIFTFAYAVTAQVVEVLNAFILKSSGQVRTSNSGRNRRPVTIKLDDSRVL
jgi:primosomal protein N' (replication factor Y)